MTANKEFFKDGLNWNTAQVKRIKIGEECYCSTYSKTCVKRPLKNGQYKDLNDKWWLNEGQRFCRMLLLEYFAILLTCIK